MATWKQIENILDQVLELEEPERTRYIEEHIDDEDLKAEIRSLLQAELHAPAWIDTGVDRLLESEDHIHDIADSVKEQQIEIDRYRILKEIGRGGMSVVYLAERTDGEFDQQVAVKIIQPFGLDRDDRFRRLRAERQILASLKHPNIARVFDGGMTPEGWPYMVMEWVEGMPITTYCRKKNLNLHSRLDLFQKVCEAVIYAHRNLVVHRDLKPGNILVTESGDVKLLDFGIAKMLEDDPEVPPLTQTGRPLMTPEYAAPEQFRGETITTSVDVYSLGVILYELLTDVRPQNFSEKSITEIERMVCEEEPVKPSENGSLLTATSGFLKGDLDVICLKSLRKEPGERYSSVLELQEDINRYFSGLPIIARPASTAYRIRKFTSRHKVGVGITGFLFLLLVGFISVLYHQQRITATERDKAQLEAKKAEEVTGFMLGLFEAGDPTEAKGDTLTAHELLSRGVERSEALHEQPEIQAEMLRVMGNAYFNLALYSEAESLLTQSLRSFRDAYGKGHPEVARTMTELGRIWAALDRREEADSLYREALTMQEQLLGNDHLDIAETLSLMSGNHIIMRRDSTDILTAEKELRKAMAIRRNQLGSKHPDIAKDLLQLSTLMYYKQDRQAQEDLLHRALAMQQELLGDDHFEVAETKGRLGTTLYNAGRYDEAEILHREALAVRRKIFGEEHPWVANSLNALAMAVSGKGNHEAAAALFEEALALFRKVFGKNNPKIASLINNASQVYMNMEDYDKAEAMQREALEMDLKWYGPDSPYTASSYISLSNTNRKQGNLDEAETWARKSLAIDRRMGDDLYTAWDLFQLALVEEDRQNYAAAEALRKEGMALQANVVSENHHHTASSLHGLARVYIKQARFEEAEPMLRKALAIRTKAFGDDDYQTAETKSLLGACLTKLRQFEEAEELLINAYTNLQQNRGANDRYILQAARHLAELYDTWNKPEKAAEFRSLLASEQ